MTALEYINSFGMMTEYTEEEAMKMVLKSHAWQREDIIKASEHWQNLPEWKRWLCRKLGLVSIY